MTKKTRVIFIPGNGGDGSTNGDWFPYLKEHLTAFGCEVLSPTFPDGELARASYWLPFIESLGADEHTILIGHSSGAVAAMRYAENHRILGSALIAPCYTDLGYETEKVSGYYDAPWDWNKIRSNQNWIVQFASTDDQFIPIEESRHIHEKLETDYAEIDNSHHFFPQEEFPELLEAIKRHI